MRYLFTLLLFFFTATLLRAQPAVEGEIRAADTVRLSVIGVYPDSFPSVSVIFKAETPQGEPLWNLTTESVSVNEDSMSCKIISVEKISKNVTINTALVIDHSGSMSEDEPLHKWWDSLPPDAFKTRTITMRDYTDGEVNSDEPILVRTAPPNPPWYHTPLWYAQQASLTYLSTIDATKDPVAIVGFSENVDQVSPLSKNRGSLTNTINGLYPTGGTAFFDAVDRALDQFQNAQGINAVIAMTDGNDNRSRKSLASVIEKAKKLSIPVFVIGLGDVNRSVLKKLASQTGGIAYFTNNKEELGSIYLQISKRIQSVYELVYESPSLASTDTSRDVMLRFKVADEFLDSRTLDLQLPPEVIAKLKAKEDAAAQAAAEPEPAPVWPYAAAGAVVLLAGAGILIARARKNPKKKQDALLITNIFPNPTSGPLTVQFTNSDSSIPADLIISDMNGVELIRVPATGASVQLDLGQFSSGTYLVMLQGSATASPVKQLVISK